MNRRNWLQLARKLVDRYDMDYMTGALQAALGQQALAFFGEGVLATTQYPVPFPIVMSTSLLGGNVGDGIAFDPQGQQTQIPSAPGTSNAFTISPADPTNSRWDLLVIRYAATGAVAIPQPSDPLITTYLDLVDDFVLAVIPGTPSGTPAYPAKGALDIILCGLQVPAGSTLGSSVIVDLTVRDIAAPFQMTRPVFVQETPVGIVDGTNQTFTLSQAPRNAQSLRVFVNDLIVPITQWSLSGQSLTLGTAPALGQQPYVEYNVALATSENPLSGIQEIPSGIVDGVNGTYQLAGMPYDKASTSVFVNGRIVSGERWSLVQGSTASQILFAGANLLQLGQSIYVTYFKNAAPAQTTVSTGGSTAGSALVPYGSSTAPVIVDPAVGVEPLSQSRQLLFCQPVAGSGATEVRTSPQIADGGSVGQELILIGTSDSDYLTLIDGNGLALNGPVSLQNNVQIYLVWTGSVWSEVSRR